MRSIFAVFCLFSAFSAAQVSDGFTDKDLTKDPAWKGDTSAYKVNTSKQLQLNSSGSDSAAIYTSFSLFSNTEWQFWLKMAFSPSDNNLAKLYLMANGPLKAPLDGYYIRLGENGSFDSIDLWKQKGGVETKIIDGIPGRCAGSSNTLRIKVTRDNLGNWTLYSDSTGGTNFIKEGQVQDSSVTSASFLGVFSKHTSSNASAFYYDDIYAGPVMEKAQPLDIIINEVLPDPLAGGVDFVEVLNRSARVIDLSSLRLSSMDTIGGKLTEIKFITTAPRVFFPGEHLVLSTDASAIRSQYISGPEENFIEMSSVPAMNIDGDVVVISDANGVIIDKLVYLAEMHFPLLNDTKGYSLERIDSERSTQEAGNWHSAAQSLKATPAYRNSQYAVADGNDELGIEPAIFSPDNDGYQDVLSIVYNFDTPGFVASLRVYDASGAEVRQLARNELLGSRGMFTWDGLNEQRVKSPAGVYIIFFEVFKSSGELKRFKKACVLATKF